MNGKEQRVAQETWVVSDPTTIDLELVRSAKIGLIGGCAAATSPFRLRAIAS